MPSASLTVKTLSILKVGFGISCLAAPTLVSKVFMIPGGNILFRLVGSRDLVVGGLLWTSNSAEEKKRALMINALIDGIDIVSCGVCLLEGSMDLVPAAAAAGGAALFLGLALLGLREKTAALGVGK